MANQTTAAEQTEFFEQIGKRAPKAPKAKRSRKGQKENFDIRSASVVRRLASKEATTPIMQGLVSKEDMGWLYLHSAQMGKEIIEATLDRKVPQVVISVEKLSKKQFGHYKPGRDGLGLKWRVALNIVHFTRPRWDVLRTLLHEQIHCLQLETPKAAKTHHDSVYRGWLEQLGIPCDPKGHSLGVTEGSPFDLYLKRHKVEGNAALLSKKDAEVVKPKGSTLRKFSCPCGVNVRVGKAEFSATCNLCDGEFALNEGD